MGDTFKKLFPGAYFSRLQENGVRVDGRENLEARKVKIIANPIGTADSSALCTIGRTSVLCGIQYSVGTPTAATPEDGRVEVFVEVGGICTPNPTDVTPIELEEMLRRLLASGLVNTKDLCIRPQTHAWVIKCHIMCLDDDGNLRDATIFSLVEALALLRLPSDIMIAENDDMVRITTATRNKRLEFNFQPVPLTVGLFDHGAGLLVDPCADEEAVVEGVLTVLVDAKGTTCLGIVKLGGVSAGLEVLDQCLDIALKRNIFRS